MMHKRLLACGLLSAALAGSASAHHSFAMFDRDKQVTLHGIIKEFQWTNPHSWVQVVVMKPDGQGEQWSLECLSPNVLSRMGWKRNSLKAGDDVTVVFNPMRDGSHGGNMVSVTLANGQKVGG